MPGLVSEQAKRLKRIRLYLGMTREEFANVAASSPFTIRSWENGQKHFGEKAVKKIIHELTKIQLTCSFEWMMYGQGISPISLFEASTEALPALSVCDSAAKQPLLNEIYAIKSAYPDITVISVADDSFQPFAKSGDFIGLRVIEQHQLHQYLNALVVYTLQNAAKGTGIVKANGQLVILALDKSSTIYLSDVQMVQEILWYRRVIA